MSTPPACRIELQSKLKRGLIGPLGRYTGITGLVFILLATTLYSGSSASSNRADFSAPELVKTNPRNSSFEKSGSQPSTKGLIPSLPSLRAASLMPPQSGPLGETVTTYASDCETPKSAFNFGDTVCAKIEGGPPLLVAPRRFSWVSPDNVVRSQSSVTTLPETNLFVIPARDPSNDLRELWRVNSISSRSSVRASAYFTVSDPNEQAANLSVYDNINTNTSAISGGSDIEFALWIVNRGPDPATAVAVTSVATNATFVSASQDLGPQFTCMPSAGGTTCTIPTLDPGTATRIAVLYHVVAGATVGTVITNTATISSGTSDQHTPDNSSTATAVIASEGNDDNCSLACPSDIVSTATTTQGGVRGAFVAFDVASSNCGAITASPASGSFFPVGAPTTVTVNSGAGETCSFNVTVTEDGPTISCPGNVEKNAGADCSVALTTAELGSPTTTGTDVSVEGERSDGQALAEPFPIGVTTIVWTATDGAGRTVSCSQTVTVTGTDNVSPTITAPPDITDTTGAAAVSCGKIVGESDLGTPTTDDNCSTVHVARTGVPAGNFFPIGTTTITYTATDASGNTAASVTQTVTISDDAPPVIKAPADASYVCPSEVPAANPAQATRGDVFDDNGNLLPPAPPSDNCSTPTVTVSESSSGSGSTTSPLIITRIFTATDNAGNSSSDTQTITVIDGIPPTITAPANVTAATGPDATSCSMIVSDALLGSAAANDNCSVSVTRSGVPAGNVFPKGITTVTYTATDGAGNTATATQTVTVVDTTPPIISCQANIIADFNPAVNGAVVTYTTPVGADNCAGATTIQTAGLASGSTFPLGTTLNTFRVTDASGNFAECSFKVTVALTSIIGLDSVSISGASLVDSYNSAGGYPATKGSLANVVSNGTITLANSGKVAGNVRSTRAGVTMSGATQVTGNATAGTTVSRSGSATVGGTITNNALAPVITLPPVPACGPPYSSTSGITGTYSYNASTGDLSLSGVNNATLANGTYCFHNVTLTNSAQLRVNGAVVIRMTGTLSASGATTLTNTTSSPANLRILSSYSGANGVTFGNSTNVYLVIYAPNTGVSDSGAAPLFGTIAGKTITLSNSGMIHYDTQLKAIWPDVWTLILGP